MWHLRWNGSCPGNVTPVFFTGVNSAILQQLPRNKFLAYLSYCRYSQKSCVGQACCRFLLLHLRIVAVPSASTSFSAMYLQTCALVIYSKDCMSWKVFPERIIFSVYRITLTETGLRETPQFTAWNPSIVNHESMSEYMDCDRFIHILIKKMGFPQL